MAPPCRPDRYLFAILGRAGGDLGRPDRLGAGAGRSELVHLGYPSFEVAFASGCGEARRKFRSSQRAFLTLLESYCSVRAFFFENKLIAW